MSSSENGRSDCELESDDEPQQNLDLDASDTDSDEEENVGEDTKPKSLKEMVAEQLNKKYAERFGKQLHIRFPHKLPEADPDFQKQVKALSPLIVRAHKPRQKHARFCLVDFNSREERDIALQAIKASGKSDEPKIVASIPRTESTEFINELVLRKVNALEKKRAKARLRRASKLALRDKNFTSSIVISNLPRSASVTEVRTLFPTAVDVQIRPSKGRLMTSSVAVITLPTTLEARAAVKQAYSLGGTELILRFDTHQRKQYANKLKKAKKTSDNGNIGPILKKKRIDNTLKTDKKSSMKKIKLNKK